MRKCCAGNNLAAWQGPAILCWNNQVFSPADFHSISKVSAPVGWAASQPLPRSLDSM